MLELNKIYCLDCFELLKNLDDNSIDLVIVDPPYNSKVIEWDNKDDTWQLKWLTEVKRVLKEGGSLYVFFAPLNMYEVEGWIRNNLTLKNILVWYHANLYGAGMSYGKDRYKSTWDVVFYGVKGKKAKHNNTIQQIAYLQTGKSFDVMIYPQPRPLLHKAQKPLELIKKFIICSSEENDIVLDCFCGVGTTMISSKVLKRNFIGGEINQDFVNISNQRLDNIHNLKEIDKYLWRQLKGKL